MSRQMFCLATLHYSCRISRYTHSCVPHERPARHLMSTFANSVVASTALFPLQLFVPETASFCDELNFKAFLSVKFYIILRIKA